jgi:hypothetical protein
VLVVSGERDIEPDNASGILAGLIRTRQYRQSVGTIIDFRRLVSGFQYRDMCTLIDIAAEAGGLVNRRIAMVTVPDGLRYGLAREAAAIAALRGADARVFSELDEAMRWLQEVEARENGRAG